MSWKSRIIKSLAGFSIALALYDSWFVVDQREQAVVTLLGDPKRVILNPLPQNSERVNELKENYAKEGIIFSEGAGFYFKWPVFERAREFDRRLLRWDGFPEQINTRDKKFLWVDSTVRWFIEDPLTYLRRVGTEEQAHAKLDDVVDSSTRNEITSRDLIEIVRTTNRKMQVIEKELEDSIKVDKIYEGRVKVTKEIEKKAREICKQYGIGIAKDGFLIKGLTYVDEVKEKVEDRMISERMRIAQKYLSEGEGEAKRILGEKDRDLKKITSEAYKQAQEIIGEADAKAVKLYADAYSRAPDFYRFLKSMEVYQVGFSRDTELLLGTDNDLLRYIKSPNIPSTQPSTTRPSP